MDSTVLNYYFFQKCSNVALFCCSYDKWPERMPLSNYTLIWHAKSFSIHRRIISRMNVELVNDISPLYSIVNGDFFPLPPVSRVKPAMFNCTSALWLDEHPSSAENSTCQRFRLRSIYSKDTDCVSASLLGTIR